MSLVMAAQPPSGLNVEAIQSLSIQGTAMLNEKVSLSDGKNEQDNDTSVIIHTPNDAVTDDMTDEELIVKAMHQRSNEKFLVAAALLRQVRNPTFLTAEHTEILRMADMAQQVYHTLSSMHPEDEGWKRQNEIHGKRDTAIYYKMNGTRLTCRIETPIEHSLLQPLLSVMNESDLYASWMPNFQHPRLGVKSSTLVAECGRGNQVVSLVIQMPFPISHRESFQHAFAVDAIEEEQHAIIIKIQSLEPGPYPPDLVVPKPDWGVVRIDLDAGMLIRACPADHPLLQQSHANYHGEEMLLFSLCMSVDGHVSYVPMTLINFVTRTVLGRFWGTLLSVAEEVRDGKRPDHAAAIEKKADLYEWVENRIWLLFSHIQLQKETSNIAEENDRKNEKDTSKDDVSL
jgi:hypothetical protein